MAQLAVEAMNSSVLRRGSFCLLFFVLVVSVSCDDQTLEHRRMIEACEKIRIGDTEQIVRDLMGTPMDVRIRNNTLGKGKALDYWAPSIVASSPSVYLDESGHVEEITCYESHHLRKDKNHPQT